jgi:predicted dehydrogenase/threonine dehydrogenase-like Zn-dependent dehydrogenase
MPGHLLLRSTRSLISAGTERMLVDFGKASILGKARQQPDKVRMVLDKFRTDGLLPTIASVRNKLDQPLVPGYCNVGVVLEVGAGVTGYRTGDRVASNGTHAETVVVPEHLCAKIPDNVSDESAAFTVVGAVALQAIRLVQPTLGEAFAVIGVGLVGLMAVKLLRSQGCRVMAVDLDEQRLALAQQFGAEVVNLSRGEDALVAAAAFSRNRGVDGALITASTTSNEPVSQAAKMCRKRGRIVLVGVTGLELSRADFYEKELTFQVSCSYGPGRYDPAYEEAGHDYPIGFVRWTEQRNFEAVLDLMASGAFDVTPLISHRFPIERADEAYALLTSNMPSLGILLDYVAPDKQSLASLTQRIVRLSAAHANRRPSLGFLGAGSYAGGVLIPAFKAAGAGLHTIASAGGVSALHHGRKHGFTQASSDTGALIADPAIDAVVVATPHDSHARYAIEALRAGKHVFVEKPLCLTTGELGDIQTALFEQPGLCLMVGFNRRFAPHVVTMKSLLTGVAAPKVVVVTVNAGAVPANHWARDAVVGGGRIIGEACHFIDLSRFLVGAPIVSVHAVALPTPNGATDDNVSFTLTFKDGSVGTVHYVTNGHRSFPKERVEVFCGRRILQLDNFRRMRGFGWPRFNKMSLWRQDKGQRACAAAFVNTVRQGQAAPIPFDELRNSTLATFAVVEAMKSGRRVYVGGNDVIADRRVATIADGPLIGIDPHN